MLLLTCDTAWTGVERKGRVSIARKNLLSRTKSFHRQQNFVLFRSDVW